MFVSLPDEKDFQNSLQIRDSWAICKCEIFIIATKRFSDVFRGYRKRPVA